MPEDAPSFSVDTVDGCRVHPDAAPLCDELCSKCWNRLHNLHRGRSRAPHRPFTVLQRETLLGLGRPTPGMRRRWPGLESWIAQAKQEERAGVIPTPLGRSPFISRGRRRMGPPCKNLIHSDERNPPASGVHGLCRVCRNRLQVYRSRPVRKYHSLIVQTLLGAPMSSMESIAESWKDGAWLLEERRRWEMSRG